MDMKRILQAMDGVATKPVEGGNDMKKFLQVVTEGANPHKVSLPVQMAMQHYQQPEVKPVVVEKKPSLLKQYFQETEDTVAEQIAEEDAVRQQRVRMYSQKIAERVLMKESRTDEIAGAFPSPSTRAKWAADAAASNAAEAKRQAALKVQADAERLKTNTELVDKEQKTNYHSLDGVAVPPKTNEEPVVTVPTTPPTTDSPFAHFSNEYLQKAVDAMRAGVRMRLLISGPDAEAELKRRGVIQESPIEITGDPNDPVIHSHAKANPMSLKGRIQQARNQLKELANMAESDDLVVWQKICQLSKGGMFMGLEQNIEQVRHGIEQLAAKRKQGGVASRGIDKNIGEDEDPCWKDYKQVGMKKKGGKQVPNCVPKE